ncbi:hypothetical protein, partial [Chroococcidiopsis cubana]|uniref:hypothetical protein n=1 Tax=Chroococcidiopsis cubana TaxID=171392 RepID=UPI002158D892
PHTPHPFLTHHSLEAKLDLFLTIGCDEIQAIANRITITLPLLGRYHTSSYSSRDGNFSLRLVRAENRNEGFRALC